MKTPINWTRTEEGLVQEYSFEDFSVAFRFLSHVAEVAERMNHHPEIWNSYNKVKLTLFTHDAAAVTEKDIALAEAINALG